jgi:hypothetical protein
MMKYFIYFLGFLLLTSCNFFKQKEPFKPVSRNTFMVFGNTYIMNPAEAKTSILASINKAVEDANIEFVIIVGEVTMNAAVDEFKAVKYVMDNSPVPVYVTASNHDLVDDSYAQFSEMLETETEYTFSKGRSFFIMQSHIDSIGTNFTNKELAKLENSTAYDFVYQVVEIPLADGINLDSKPIIGIRGANPWDARLNVLDGRHVIVWPMRNKDNDNEDDYLIYKENEGYVVVDSYVDRSLNKSFKITIDRSAGTSSFENL